MNYRLATTADLAPLAQMNHQLIRDEGHRNPMDLPQLQERMAGWFQRGEYEAVLFEDQGVVMGYALYRRVREWVYLRQFFVKPQFRRRGVGRQALAWLRVNTWKDSPRLRIEVLTGNAVGIAFWRSVGFADYSITMELGADSGNNL